jgi:hypothetical protein
VLPEAMYSYLVTGKMKYKKILPLTFTIPLFHERPTQSNLKQGGLKKENESIFYGEQPIEVATTIIALICSMMSLRTESIKSNLS